MRRHSEAAAVSAPIVDDIAAKRARVAALDAIIADPTVVPTKGASKADEDSLAEIHREIARVQRELEAATVRTATLLHEWNN